MSSAFLGWTTSCRGLLRGLGGLRGGGNESAFGGCHDLGKGKDEQCSEVEKIRFTLDTCLGDSDGLVSFLEGERIVYGFAQVLPPRLGSRFVSHLSDFENSRSLHLKLESQAMYATYKWSLRG